MQGFRQTWPSVARGQHDQIPALRFAKRILDSWCCRGCIASVGVQEDVMVRQSLPQNGPILKGSGVGPKSSLREDKNHLLPVPVTEPRTPEEKQDGRDTELDRRRLDTICPISAELSNVLQRC